MNKKIFCFDCDGVICTEEKTFSRSLAKPIADAKETINSIYDSGHHVMIYSARSWSEFEMTKDWLDKHGIKYHQLLLGKPGYDVFVDDRALRFTTWKKVVKKMNKFFGIKI